MSLLMLFNSESDVNIIGMCSCLCACGCASTCNLLGWGSLLFPFCPGTDQSEQFQIKHLCLGTILELLLTCKMCPRIGDRAGRFLHVPRTATLQANTIGYVDV